MKKLLYFLFRKTIDKIVFDVQQSKKKNYSNLLFAFADSKGQKYYKWIDEIDNIPVERKAAMERIGTQLEYLITDVEMDKFLNAMDKALYEAVYEKKREGISTLGYLVAEMKRRKKMLVHKEIFLSLIAVIHIREDEKPHIFDEVIHDEKIKQFEADNKQGLYDFFLQAGIGEYVLYFKKLQDNWEQELINSQAEINATSDMVTSLLSDQKLSKENKTGSKKN